MTDKISEMTLGVEKVALAGAGEELPGKDSQAGGRSGVQRAKPPRAGGSGGGRREESPETQLSKALSYILRHGAASEGLKIRSDGYIELEKVLARPKMSKIGMPLRESAAEGQAQGKSTRSPDVQDVMDCVESNAKKRFEVRKDDDERTLLIRAVQGHSIKDVVDLDHTPLTLENLAQHLPRKEGQASSTHPAYTLVHGTTNAAFEQILSSGGLLTMSRNHVHLAKGVPGAEGVISGMRGSSTVRIFVDVERALRDGIAFGVASNGAVLTAGVPHKPAAPDPPQAKAAEAVRTLAPEPTPAQAADGASQAAAEAGDGASRKFPPRKPRPPQPSKKRAKAGSSAESAGILPVKYFARVEDQKGNVIWTPAAAAKEPQAT